MFFPDKTEEDNAKLAASLALIQTQTDIDKAEAQSTDPLQHWRGGLGMCCRLCEEFCGRSRSRTRWRQLLGIRSTCLRSTLGLWPHSRLECSASVGCMLRSG